MSAPSRDRFAKIQPEVSSDRGFFSASAIVLSIAALKLLFHLFTANRYGIFRDELYYLACAEHLDWGYVDQPPLIAFITWVSTRAFGSSLLALRLLPAIAGAALVWLTARVTKELGGGRVAQGMAALAVVLAPVYLLMHHWLTMNAFEPLIWLGCVWCIVRAINTARTGYWLGFGVLVGIGAETKYTIAFFVAAVVAGLILTPQRRVLVNRWFWLGAAAGFLIFLPNLVWLIQHHFPFLELMNNIRRSGRDVVRGPVAFVADQATILNPALFPLWFAGLMWLFFGQTGRRYRILGWTYLAVLALFIVLKGKNYYVAPAYPMLFASGAIVFENLKTTVWKRVRFVYVVILLLIAVLLAPLNTPVLPVETYLHYQSMLGIAPIRAENQPTGPLPQYFADEFGWEDMTREVARIYKNLPAEQRASTAIFANNYGEAGAIDFFGPKYGLPKAISNHQSYWLWGPRDYTGEMVIVLGSDGRGDREHFDSVDVAGRAAHRYSRIDEHFDIFLCRRLSSDLRAFWPQTKHWN
jgi:4-amino-4-deoxy-L-arabinose transferase-like glycosyltransferase